MSELTMQELREVWYLMEREFRPATQPIVRVGEAPRRLFIVASGTVRVEKADGSSIERSPGDSFGEMWLLYDLPAKTRIVAETDTMLFTLARDALAPFMLRNPDAALKVHEAAGRSLADRMGADG